MPSDNTIKENAYLRCAPSYISNGQVPAKNINAYTFNSDLFNGDSTFSPENIKTIRSIPERIDNDIFGFTQHIENSSDSGQLNNPISYFTLNVNDISSRGYTGLKLKLHYNVLFNATYNDDYEPQDLEKLQINNTNCCDSHPFIFNYFLSNSDTWDYRTDEGKCISDSTNPKFNLYSSIEKENDDWAAKDIDENHLYTFNVFDNKNTDPWGDIKTYNKFYVAKANTGKHYPYLHKVEFLGYNKTYYTCFDFNVGEYNTSNTYLKGSVIKQNDIRYIAQKNIEANTPPADNNTTSPAYSDNPSNAPWIKLNIEKYTHDYSTEFEEGKFLSACDKNKWGTYSGDFIPYFVVSSKDFYLDNINSNYLPDSELTDTTTAYINTNIWEKQYIPDFNKNSYYSSGNKSYPNFKRNNQVFTDLKYNYIGYKNEFPSNSNVTYTLNDEKIYFNEPYRNITQINPLNLGDDSIIYFQIFDPASNFTAGNWSATWQEMSAADIAWLYNYNSSNYITQLSADIYGSRPDWCGSTARNDRIVYVNSNNQLMLRYLTGSTTKTVIEKVTTIKDLFGPLVITATAENLFKYFFVKANVDSTFNTASNYSYSSFGEIYKTGEEFKFYKNGAYYVIFKNGPYLGNPEDYPPTGDEHIFYAYSAGDYRKVEDNNYHQVITNRFFTNEFINNITTYYNTGWDSSTRYNRFDAVIYQAPGESNTSMYYALVDNTNSNPAYVPGPAPYSRNNIPQLWNESGYSLYNSKYASYSGLQNYKNFNVRGNTEFTIDLTNTDKQYIHIAYPSTTLLDSDDNSGKFPESACHTFITDLKMSYEGVE